MTPSENSHEYRFPWKADSAQQSGPDELSSAAHDG